MQPLPKQPRRSLAGSVGCPVMAVVLLLLTTRGCAMLQNALEPKLPTDAALASKWQAQRAELEALRTQIAAAGPDFFVAADPKDPDTPSDETPAQKASSAALHPRLNSLGIWRAVNLTRFDHGIQTMENTFWIARSMHTTARAQVFALAKGFAWVPGVPQGKVVASTDRTTVEEAIGAYQAVTLYVPLRDHWYIALSLDRQDTSSNDTP